jgi:hypothetical protein
LIDYPAVRVELERSKLELAWVVVGLIWFRGHPVGPLGRGAIEGGAMRHGSDLFPQPQWFNWAATTLAWRLSRELI